MIHCFGIDLKILPQVHVACMTLFNIFSLFERMRLHMN
jgi:hypothetical protein